MQGAREASGATGGGATKERQRAGRVSFDGISFVAYSE